MKRALITGITGQDGSYLAELLLSRGYEVHGLVRRASTLTTERIDHLYVDPHEPGCLHLHFGDLADASSLRAVIARIEPDEVYNLAAQSHVRVSYDQPEYTADVVATGTLRLLEACRPLGSRVRFYEAASSEMYGSTAPPQNEETPFHPRSPYAAAKVAAFEYARVYREAYGMHVSSGILFNHECLASHTPLIVRTRGAVMVTTPRDLISLRHKGPNVQTTSPVGVEVWDGSGWSPIRAVTATKRRHGDPDHRMCRVQARAGTVTATAHHRMLDAARATVRADCMVAGSHVALGQYPPIEGWTSVHPDLAELLGHLAANGYVAEDGSGIQYTDNDDKLRGRVAELWERLFVGTTREGSSPSGFKAGNHVAQLYLRGAPGIGRWLRAQLYTRESFKVVPALVLNGSSGARIAFLTGYYAGDGLHAGNGDSFKTNSAALAQGLCWLYAGFGRTSSVYVEQRDEATYYQINLSAAVPSGRKGQHLRKDPHEVRKIDEVVGDDWVFDVETGSGVLMAGVGRVVVHNSERRGETFVTRKITRAATRIALGLQERLYLGNLDAMRDWGHAADYVDAMWRMLQQDRPDDYVIATGESYSVRAFVHAAFRLLDLDPDKHLAHDPRYLRPAEVESLRGDASKARRVLGWQPTVSFEDMVAGMVSSDMELAKREATLRQNGHRVDRRFEP